MTLTHKLTALLITFPLFAFAGSYASAPNTSIKKSEALKALGTNSGGGGDEVGLDFIRSFKSAMAYLKKQDSKMYEKLKYLEGEAAQLDILVVDETLGVNYRKIIQNSIAANFPEENLILINRARWNQTYDSELKDSIAFHEVLSLKDLEATGRYPISSLILTSRGGDVAQLKESLAVDRVVQLSGQNPKANSYQILKKLFEETTEPADTLDFEINKARPLKCATALKLDGSLVESVYMTRLKVTVQNSEAAGPDLGPLLSGKSAVELKQDWVIWTSDDRGPEESGYGLTAIGNKITKTDRELIQTMPASSFSGFSPKDTKMFFRRNNGFIAYRIVSEGGLPLYGYCFRR